MIHSAHTVTNPVAEHEICFTSLTRAKFMSQYGIRSFE
jgi:hypothetical protein